MFRLLILIGLVVAVAAIIAPALRDTLGWVLAFFCALMIGDLLRSSLAKVRRRNERPAR